jgi:hypothetical protein
LPEDLERTDPRALNPEIKEIIRAVEEAAEDAAVVRVLRDLVKSNDEVKAALLKYAGCAEALATSWLYEIGFGKFKMKAGAGLMIGMFIVVTAWAFDTTPLEIVQESRRWWNGDGVPTEAACAELYPNAIDSE